MKHLKLLVGIIMMLALPTIVFPGQESPDVKDFWHSFRQAVLRNSIDQVSALTHFPFEVRGPDESDPIVFYDRKGFRNIFKRVVVQPVYVRSNGKSLVKSMLQVIEEKTDIIPADYLTSESMQIEQFEFQRIKGRWCFTRAYLEE
jgi:hypothetical protein